MPALPFQHPAAWAFLILAVVAGVLSIVLTHVRRERARDIYLAHFGNNPSRERLLLAAIAFYVSFAAVRAITHAIHAGRGPFHDVSMGGRHIHHLVWGVLLLLLVGYAWLWQLSERSRAMGRSLALAYGVGAALTLDEYALILNLRDVYWEREGRASIDAVLLFSALLSIGIFGGPFFHALTREAVRHVRSRLFTK